MTKEEVIDAIIERYKGFENKGRINIFNCCPEIDCDYCPFESRDCTNGIAMSLLDRLLKAEEHQETNLEHYRDSVIITDAYVAFKNSDYNTVTDWLLAPYEEPKPKYKLSKFEYDLLQVSVNKWERILKYTITDSYTLEKMADRGYFKNIPLTIPIKDILGNCEVIDE